MNVRELLTKFGFDIDDKNLQAMDARVGAAKKNLNNFLGVVQASTVALGAMSAGVGLMLKKASQMEQWQISFEVALGSAERANALLADITKFGAETPFNVTGLVDSSQKLLGMGYAAEEIIPTLKTLGDVAAGVGMEKMPSLVDILARVRSNAKLGGEELNRFLDAGVGLLGELGKLNKNASPAQVRKLVSQGKISYEQTLSALQALTSEGGQFFNLMARQAKSQSGLWSSFEDQIEHLAITIGTKLLPTTKKYTVLVMDWIEANKALIEKKVLDWIDTLVAFSKNLAKVFITVYKIAKVMAAPIGGLENAFKGLTYAVVAFLGVQLAAGLGNMVLALTAFIKTAWAFIGVMRIMGATALLVKAVLLAKALLIGALVIGIALVIEDIITFFEGGKSVTGDIVAWIKQKWQELMDTFGPASFTVDGWSEWGWNLIKSIWLGMVEAFDALILGGIDKLFGPLAKAMGIDKILGDVETGFYSLLNATLGGTDNATAVGSNNAGLVGSNAAMAGVTVPGFSRPNVVPLTGPGRQQNSTNTQTFNNNIEVNANGLDAETAKQVVRQGVMDAQEQMLREASRNTRTRVVE